MLDTISLQEYIKRSTRQSPFPQEALDTVQTILRDIQLDQDQAVRDYTKRFDRVDLVSFRVTETELNDAYQRVDSTLIQDLKIAKQNIETYHQRQRIDDYEYEVTSGGTVGQRMVPIDAVGMYVPGGTAAYPSTVLMNAIPAQVAGVKRIVMISPPNQDGTIDDIILAAAKVAGVTEIYKVGGAQGIGALAYGTETIPKVDKIVGPGNMYVALAKREVFGIVGIDMVAGPSEILIYADDASNPEYIASDLLSQAEHDPLAQSILVTTSESLIEQVNLELEQQLASLSRSEIARMSIIHQGLAILVSDEEEAIQAINTVAPEHLELLISNPRRILPQIRNAGAVFLGPYSPEPLGDYIAGPNHTLPTSGTARFSSALGTQDFIKRMSVIEFSKDALSNYQQSIVRLANKEGLTAHASAIERRFKYED